jgi:uncharacterized membrane protein
MDVKRIFKHLLSTDFALRKAFPTRSLEAIEQAIGAGERKHRGEIRFAVENALDIPALLRGQSARERAIEVFAQQHVWDTEYNTGVLVYLLLADRDVEIVADRGIDAKLAKSAWETVCHTMEELFGQGRFEEGVVSGIQAISALLERHYPAQAVNPNELPDKPVIL